jgi:hypothetical protein
MGLPRPGDVTVRDRQQRCLGVLDAEVTIGSQVHSRERGPRSSLAHQVIDQLQQASIRCAQRGAVVHSRHPSFAPSPYRRVR